MALTSSMGSTPDADSSNDAPRDLGNAGNVAWAYERVRSLILQGDLAPGDPISQVKLSQRLGISRTPLREVLRLLENEGLVESEHNRRVRVAPLSLADVEETYATRIVLEALAIRLSMPTLDAYVTDQMRDALEEMREQAAREDYERWSIPHRRFHQLATCGAEVRLSRMLDQLSDHAERYRRLYTVQSPHAWSTGLLQHGAILDACLRKDPDGAAEALGRHLTHTALNTLTLVAPEHEPTRVRTALRMVLTHHHDSTDRTCRIPRQS